MVLKRVGGIVRSESLYDWGIIFTCRVVIPVDRSELFARQREPWRFFLKVPPSAAPVSRATDCCMQRRDPSPATSGRGIQAAAFFDMQLRYL